MNPITKDSLIGDVLLEYPEAQEIMIKYFGEQVACTFCPGQAFDTFAMIAELHGVEEDAVDEMIKEMNTVISQAQVVAN
jgi:hypothetical protein